ncbi:hypothetical protein BDV95DRAFT_608496 [Massariosphaeria phaeospora]|uniref:Uncharacterized protein n=1 Tax=Massariosphaeria phaeospora TaxID=100035 RepID=A0A7C8M416_9PLEO|nr:hypothetical protein BDV95DRAFT_608496 [Massariosphaeria phaeospora]
MGLEENYIRKQNIISQAQFAYGARYPHGSTFSVIEFQPGHNSKIGNFYIAQLIVYPRLDSFVERVVVKEAKAKDDTPLSIFAEARTAVYELARLVDEDAHKLYAAPKEK